MQRDRRQLFLEMFPEACRDGQLDVEALSEVIGMQARGSVQISREQLHSLRNTAGIIQSCARIFQRQFGSEPQLAPIVQSLATAAESLREQTRFGE